MTVVIRPETPADADAIAAVHADAFGGPAEAMLVAELRAGRFYDPALSLVAVDDGDVVGHVLFTPLETDGPRAAALAPVGVVNRAQGRGIGAALINAGLESLKNDGCRVVVVLGDPAYYSRFGFDTALGTHVKCPYSGPYLAALELQPGALAGCTVNAAYAPPFAKLV